jgi:hypothetical protein
MTGMGSRALKRWLLTPQRDRTEAALRLQAVAICATRPARRLAETLREQAQGRERRGTHHRPHRAAPGAPARAGGAAVHAAKD